jgi:hypothetical protein
MNELHPLFADILKPWTPSQPTGAQIDAAMMRNKQDPHARNDARAIAIETRDLIRAAGDRIVFYHVGGNE